MSSAGASSSRSSVMYSRNSHSSEAALALGWWEHSTCTAVDCHLPSSDRSSSSMFSLHLRAETAADRPAEAAAWLEKIRASADLAESDPAAMAAAAEKAGIMPKAKVAELAIPGCSIRFVPAAEAREALEKTAQIDLTQFGGELPADDFYYAAEQ